MSAHHLSASQRPYTHQLSRPGTGVFVLSVAGALEPRPQWLHSIDVLCAAVVRATGRGAAVRYQCTPAIGPLERAYPRDFLLDVTGSLGSVYMTVSICERGDPRITDRRDLPSLRLDTVQAGSDLEFWLANEADALCLVARLMIELGRGGSAVVEQGQRAESRNLLGSLV